MIFYQKEKRKGEDIGKGQQKTVTKREGMVIIYSHTFSATFDIYVTQRAGLQKIGFRRTCR